MSIGMGHAQKIAGLGWTPSTNIDVPIYRQLYARFREAIVQRQLQPGDRVPSIRGLASAMNLAHGTIEQAYQMLISEGYLLPQGAAGTIVSPQLDRHILRSPSSEGTLSAQESQGQPWSPRPFQMGLPALDAFPRKIWARLATRHMRQLDPLAMIYPDPKGLSALRLAIAKYLGISRAIICGPEQVFITAGYRGALDLIRRSVLQPGDSGWFEDPGYPHAREFLSHSGLRPVAVPVDAEGLQVSVGIKRAAQARFAVVTPTHQSPLGMALSLPRRLTLLDWANERNAWIIEDDYDSEFRYHGHPLPALKSLDVRGRVLYTGTFSKTLLPSLGLAYLVVPTAEINRFDRTARLLPCCGSTIIQRTVAEFMEQGYFSRHLKKMRGLYARRRSDLIEALEQRFGHRLTADRQAGGMHLLLHINARLNDQAIAAKCNDAGFAIQPLSLWTMDAAVPPGLLLGFTNVKDQREATALACRLSVAWGE